MGYERSFFRLLYPEHDRPTLRIDGRDHSVADLSEQGVRFLVPASEPWRAVKGELDGTVVLPGGEQLAVRGNVLRTGDGFVVLRLSQGVPLRVMVHEQRRLRREHQRFQDADLARGGRPED